MLASIPLGDPDPEAALPEIDRTADELNADGFVLVTKYGGRYLGDPSFERVSGGEPNKPGRSPRSWEPHGGSGRNVAAVRLHVLQFAVWPTRSLFALTTRPSTLSKC